MVVTSVIARKLETGRGHVAVLLFHPLYHRDQIVYKSTRLGLLCYGSHDFTKYIAVRSEMAVWF